MSTEHITYRTIDNVRCRCQDIGCDDFDRAEFNRYLVANKQFITMWLVVEQAVWHTPLNMPLASWIPSGSLLQVDKNEWRVFEQVRRYNNLLEDEAI